MGRPIKTGKVTASLLNMRVSPGGPVLRVLPYGTRIEILGRVGNWLNIRESGLYGFVSSKYVKLDPEKEEAIGAGAGTVNASLLNLRAGPGGRIVDVLPRDTVVTVLGAEGNWLQVEARGIIGYVSSKYITISKQVTLPPPEDRSTITAFRFEDDLALAPDGTRFAKRYKKGVFNYGQTSIAAFIEANRDRFATTSDSLLRVMSAVSENEGKYEAINTWDNAFLSFGIFQWTSGVGSEAGELPALLNRLQEFYPNTFDEFFGQYDLAVTGVRSAPGVVPRGYFQLKGVLLGSSEVKAFLRSLGWAYRFWLAGQDDNVREIQTRHAMDRMEVFYAVDNRRIGNFHVRDYMTSEYGVALLLDQHVNRPGHVPRILGSAVKELERDLPTDAPHRWGDEEEKRVLEKYLALRARTSMTESSLRAKRVLEHVQQGMLSDKRHSFQH